MSLLLLASLFAGIATAVPGSACSKLPYRAFLPLSKNPYVESYCSSRYPVPHITKTTSTSYITSTVVVPSTTTVSTTQTPVVVVYITDTTTSTTTLTTQTVETSTTQVTATTTSTVTAGSTTTSIYVTDANGNHYKREAEPTPLAVQIEARAKESPKVMRPANDGPRRLLNKPTRALNELAQFTKTCNSHPVLSTACSCIETPLKIKVVATSTTTTTSTSTISSTITFTSPTTTTITQSTTVQTTQFTTTTSTTISTSTTTTTSTVTAAPSVAFNACGQTFPAPDSKDPTTVKCGQYNTSGTQRQSFTAANFAACLAACDDDIHCGDFTFQFSTLQCNTYGPAPLDTQPNSSPNADYVYGYIDPAGLQLDT